MQIHIVIVTKCRKLEGESFVVLFRDVLIGCIHFSKTKSAEATGETHLVAGLSFGGKVEGMKLDSGYGLLHKVVKPS